MNPKEAMKLVCLAVTVAVAVAVASTGQGMEMTPFGPSGAGGSKNGQEFRIGSGGSVFELEAFLQVGGVDLNGASPGTAGSLSRHALPGGLVYTFSSVLAAGGGDVQLVYTFSNATASAFSDLRFFVLLDAEIDQAVNTFFNEYGTVSGVPGHGAVDGSPDQWQIDEPGFQNGSLFRNLYEGGLSNSNAVPAEAVNDVALGLGFTLGTLAPGSATTLRVMISENGRSLGSLALVQRDSDPASKTFITLSAGLAAALEGWVYADANANRRFDPGEGLANARLSLLTNGTSLAALTTDGDGHYAVSSLAPGSYAVRIDPASVPGGLALVAVQDGASANPMPITFAGVAKILNWGYAGPALTGRVYVDGDTNGVFNAGDRALGNVGLVLSNASTLVRTTTDAEGRYHFGNASVPNPAPGSYAVHLEVATLPAGLTPSAAQQGAGSNPVELSLAGTGTNTLNWAYVGGVTARASFHFTAWRLNWPSGNLLGTLSIQNTNASGAVAEPFWLGLSVSTNFFYVSPAGTNGLPYVDVTAAVKAQLEGGVLNPGQSVGVDGIEVYSRTRRAPGDDQFEWVPLLVRPQ